MARLDLSSKLVLSLSFALISPYFVFSPRIWDLGFMLFFSDLEEMLPFRVD